MTAQRLLLMVVAQWLIMVVVLVVNNAPLVVACFHNVTNVANRYSAHEDRLAIMDLSLRWGHLVPTAPDTLTTYPFVDIDPFVVTQAPHVFFAGNQPEFGSKTVTRGACCGVGAGTAAHACSHTGEGGKTLLVAVPSFASTGCIVLVNLATLQAQPMYFDGC